MISAERTPLGVFSKVHANRDLSIPRETSRSPGKSEGRCPFFFERGNGPESEGVVFLEGAKPDGLEHPAIARNVHPRGNQRAVEQGPRGEIRLPTWSEQDSVVDSG